MLTCASCGRDNPEGFSFCGFCTAPLDQEPRRIAEERKVVSILFCDLVGFTSSSEVADPEDVRARLRPYHDRVKREIEAFGGVVEKFVGDGVMAVFGAPVAHEDDPERAVRAGLRILVAIEEMNEVDPALGLAVRIAVNTGETVVALGAHPERGEAMVAGDVVNTASRLQGAAPVSAVVVGEGTYRAVAPVFEWLQLPPAELKGKAKPTPVWRVVAARGRFGVDIMRHHATPLVGREVETSLLQSLFERALRERSIQLVTIVGEPGLGKSRLVAEFASYVDGRPELVIWRQGRCLPYGDGISFWALGEIVKAQAGILESDPLDGARAKLEAALSRVADDADRAWLLQRLAPLIGSESASTAAQDEAFSAWRRFLQLIASDGPAVFIVEDLHWADEAMIAFLEHLVEWAEGVSMLVLCTARPEFYERRPGWGGGKRNTTTIGLSPLSDQETTRLVQILLESAILPAQVQERSWSEPAATPFTRRSLSGCSRTAVSSVQIGRSSRPTTRTASRCPRPCRRSSQPVSTTSHPG